MNIRAMEADDHQSVLDLLRLTDMFTPKEKQVAAELIDVYFGQPNQSDYSIDVIENEIGAVVGYVCYGPTPLTEGTVDLYWMAVHPAEKRKGYGRALIARVEAVARQQQGRLVIIETSSKEKYAPTRRFYERAGYVENARIRDFYRSGDDRVIYCKYLQAEVI